MKVRTIGKIFFLLVILNLLWGCSLKEKEYTYKANEIELSSDNYIGNVAVSDKNIYFVEKQNDQFFLQKTSIKEQITEEVPIVLALEDEIYFMCVSNEDEIYCIIKQDTIDKNATIESIYYIEKFSENGKPLYQQKYHEDNEISIKNGISFMQCDGKGNLAIVDGKNQITIYNNKCEFQFVLKAQGQVTGTGQGKNNEILISYMGVSGAELKTIDIGNKNWGEGFENPPAVMGQGGIKILSNSSMIYNTDKTYEMFNIKKNEETELINWLKSGILTGDIRCVYGINENQVVVLSSTNLSGLTLQLFEKTELTETEEKIVLKYGTYRIQSFEEELILNFEKEYPQYDIEVHDYYDENYEKDISLTKMTAEILAGNGPDIINSNYIDFYGYVYNDCFVDLYPYMEQDVDFHKEDYFENILNIYEFEGALYSIPTIFRTSTLTINNQVIENKENWNLEEFIAYMNTAEVKERYKNITLTGYSTMEVLLPLNMKEFCDYETGTCKFNSNEFISLLELGKAFPNWGSSREIETLLPVYNEISNVNNYAFLRNQKDTTYDIGFPCDSGDQYIFVLLNQLAIMKNAKDKIAAWEFVKYALSFEYTQNEIIPYFAYPVKLDYFEKSLDEMEPFTVDGITFEYTDDEISYIRNIIEGLSQPLICDITIQKIVEEEAEYFYSGSKTAEEVAEVIQNRVQLFLNESR